MTQTAHKPELPVLDKETERLEQISIWKLPQNATWAEIRDCVRKNPGIMMSPDDWELTMQSQFGSDLFEPRPILRIY